MNTRICSIIAVATLVSLSSGCGGMRNFLFGKGARCGSCNQNAAPAGGAQFGNSMQAPCGSAPGNQPCTSGCGNGQYGAAPYNGAGYSCGSCGSQAPGGCGCGSTSGAYVDPYMSSGAVTVPQGSTMVPSMPTQPMAPIEGDGFSARKFDADGNRILWEEPFYGGTSL